ncbi:MAG: response regulator transcription factor [Chloroflexi bacterium]|nr:response regulator transcription factor [Chloroflexota bacterium]MBI4316648.1 response regulator transcription factor [Chloroflexota bacterium]MBI5291970.1 response regulator transcription factor [Chloroflexota bacterium]
MKTETSILLADDHAVLRSGLRLLLDAQADLKVIGEANNGSEALALAARLQPDLILLDLTMPGLSGMEALPALRKAAPSARVLILTMHDDVGYLRQALQRGASGYVLKKAADSELVSAVRAVMRGEVYIHPSLTKSLLEGLLPNSSEAVPADPWEELSEREKEVLTLVALGHTSAEIADRLSLSVKTVETYRARGMEKLGLRSRAALVQFAIARGLLSDNPSA